MMPLRPRLGRLLGAAALLGALLGASAVAHATSFQVSPTRFEFSLARRFTNFFTVTNNSGAVLRLRVSTGFLEPDAQGKLQPVTGSPYDMAGWLVINPRRMNLAPEEKRVVRFTVRPPSGLAPGEYRTVVFFEELPPRPQAHAPEGMGLEIKLLTRLGITIYGVMGHPQAEFKVEPPTAQVTAGGVHVHAVVHNTGRLHATLDCKATLLDASGKAQGKADLRMVLQRGQQRPFRLTIPRPSAGTYRLHVTVNDGEHTVLDTELPITVGAGVQ